MRVKITFFIVSGAEKGGALIRGRALSRQNAVLLGMNRHDIQWFLRVKPFSCAVLVNFDP